MRRMIEWVKNNPNRAMFLLPIILVAGISISHVVSWYDIANPFNWAIYLSIAIEVGAMTALVAATNKIKGGVWFMFGLITIIQMIGNIFYSFKEIDENGELFKSWVELTGPFWDLFSDSSDISSMKRWLAFLEGGLLPIISLTSLHFFVKYDDNRTKIEEVETTTPPNNDQVIDENNVEKLTDLQQEAKKIWNKVNELKEEGKLTEPTEEEILEEPSALAFTPYIEDDVEVEYLTDLQQTIIEPEQLESNFTAMENLKKQLSDLTTESTVIENEDDKPPLLVEEENPEDEIIFHTTGDTVTNESKTLGEELKKTWNRIIKKNNNNIQRL